MTHQSDRPQDAMYEIVFPVPEVSGSEEKLTMVVALGGYADAGQAVSEAADFLLDALEHRPLVSFTTDELIDYRSRRPAVSMNSGEIVEISDISISLDVVQDNDGKPFLLLSGPEPDMRWDAFSQAVADLAQRYQVARAVSIYAAPMTVPHTRPLGILAHGNARYQVDQVERWGQKMRVPGSASLSIEHELAQRGLDTLGLTAQVPHYVAQSEYPLATLRLLQQISQFGRLELPLAALEKESARVAELLNEQTNESAEVSQVVNLLEQQYDAEAQRRELLSASPLLGPDGQMPSADEIGAEFEKFLASQPPRPLESSAEENLAEDSGASEPDVSPGPATEGTSESARPEEPSEPAPVDEKDQPQRKRRWKPWFRF